MKRFVAACIAASLLFLWGCDGEDAPGSAGSGAAVDFAQSDSTMFTDRDLNAQWTDATAVTLADGDVSVTKEGTYLLRGELTGCIRVEAPENAKIQLVLDGVCVNNPEGPAVSVDSADKVFLTLADGSENRLESGENAEAAVVSRCDLTINGGGTLTVVNPGGHGISGKDDLAVTGGKISVQCAGQGLDANDSVRICGGSITVTAGKDAIHAENSEDGSLGFVYLSGGEFALDAQGDGISASAWLQIVDGTYSILAGGGHENGEQHSSDGWGQMGPGMGGIGGRPRSTGTEETESSSMKGLKAGNGILLGGGSFTIDAADDAVHSDTNLTVNDGTFTIASGDDAFHAEETLTFAGGTAAVSTCYEGLEALEIYISGGEVSLTATDDGLNAAGGTDGSGSGGRDQMFGGGMGGSSNGYIEISGGTVRVQASGDGIDANGSVLICGGYTTVCGPTTGDTATLDYDTSCTITGGTFIGTGALGMVQTFSENAQGVIACRVGNMAAGTVIKVTDGKGTVLIEHAPELDFAVVILSSPELVSGREYSITIGERSAAFDAQ